MHLFFLFIDVSVYLLCEVSASLHRHTDNFDTTHRANSFDEDSRLQHPTPKLVRIRNCSSPRQFCPTTCKKQDG